MIKPFFIYRYKQQTPTACSVSDICSVVETSPEDFVFLVSLDKETEALLKGALGVIGKGNNVIYLSGQKVVPSTVNRKIVYITNANQS